MKLELHMLQNFAPSCLNRDDTNMPKDCEFGGVRRARISSQCLKRAIRQAFARHSLLRAEQGALRTKRLAGEVAKELVRRGRSEEDSLRMAKFTIEGAGLGLKPGSDPREPKTEYLLFVPRRLADGVADVIEQHWEELSTRPEPDGGAPAGLDGDAPPSKSKGGGKRKKKAAQAAFPAEIGKKLANALEDGRETPELALFGRMIADKAKWNIEAACQVAHAISTHRVTMDFDFYTAVDDLKPDDTAGADMMGTVQFNSACFYRFAVLDVDDLCRNLAGGATAVDAETSGLARQSTEAFMRAAILAIPSGKQNSMAAHNPPGFLLGVVRDGGTPWSLANAFVDPVRPRPTEPHGDLLGLSIRRLDRHFGDLARVYGAKGIRAVSWCAVESDWVSRLATLGDGGAPATPPDAAGSRTPELSVHSAQDADGFVAHLLAAAFAEAGA